MIGESFNQSKSKILFDEVFEEYKQHSFPSHVNRNSGIDHLTYGMLINKCTKKGRGGWHPTTFYINEDDHRILQWTSRKKSPLKSRINLLKVSRISETPACTLTKKLKQVRDKLLSIIYSGNELILVFTNKQLKMEWWAGLEYYIDRAYNMNKHRA